MANSNKFERKIIASLAKVILEEKKQLAKSALIATASAGVGGLLLALCLLQASHVGNGATWFVSIGLISGILFGLSLYFFSALGQWPVLKRFLDTEAILKAHNQEPF